MARLDFGSPASADLILRALNRAKTGRSGIPSGEAFAAQATGQTNPVAPAVKSGEAYAAHAMGQDASPSATSATSSGGIPSSIRAGEAFATGAMGQGSPDRATTIINTVKQLRTGQSVPGAGVQVGTPAQPTTTTGTSASQPGGTATNGSGLGTGTQVTDKVAQTQTSQATQPGGGGAGQQVPITDQLYQKQISQASQLASQSSVGASMVAQVLTSALDTIQQREAELKSRFAAEGKQFDPATANALEAIKQAAAQQLSNINADLNRRGLYDSGIRYAALGKTNEAEIKAVQSTVSQWAYGLNQSLNAALDRLFGQKLDLITNVGLKQADYVQHQQDVNTQTTLHLGDQAQRAQEFGLTYAANRADAAQRAQEFNQQFSAGRQDAEQQAREFAQQMGYNYDRLTADQKRFAQTLAEQKRQFDLSLNDKSAGSSDYAMTSQAIARVLALPPEKQWDYFQNNAQAWAEQGVDVSKVYKLLQP